MVDGYSHIAEPVVEAIGLPSSAGSTYVNTSNNYDCAIAGLPFFLGITSSHPYKRETAQYRKQQIDQQREPGEQTLTGWWLRSQSSFHYGAGIRYEEPIEGDEVEYRFTKSAGVDVFNIGRVTLLPDVTLNHTASSAPLMIGGHDANGIDVVIWSDGSTLYRTTAAGSTAALTWGGSGTILSITQDGLNYYAVNATGVYKGPLTGATNGTIIFTHPSVVGTVTTAKIAWVKQRLILGINNYMYEVVQVISYNITDALLTTLVATLKTDGTAHNFSIGSTVAVSGVGTAYNGTWTVTAVPDATRFSYTTTSSDVAEGTVSGTAQLSSNTNLPIYAHPDAKWQWTGICEGPNAIYVSGFVGDSSTVFRLALDTAGQVPLLTRALTAADMPKGEIIYALGAYIGKYMVFGTNKGVRIGEIDTSGFVSSGFITYGPLSVITNGYDPASATILNGYPVKSIAFQDRFAYCTVTDYIDNGDGTFSSGLVKIDISRQISANQAAYATHLRVPSIAEAAAVCTVGATNALAIGVTGVGMYMQSTNLVSSGYLQTGQIRYLTLEDKHFELVKLRETLPMLGTLKLSSVLSTGEVTDIITVDGSFDFTQDITGLDAAADTAAQESIALKFTFYPESGQQVGNEDSFNGYQLKALPAVARERIYTMPLMCYDFEEDRYNMVTGYDGRAMERLSALEDVESNGDVVILQDFTNNETIKGVIESISFNREAPSDRRFDGFGGIINLQFRTIVA